MKKQKRILTLILILSAALLVLDLGLFFFELISELVFFIIGAIALLPLIICIVLLCRLMKILSKASKRPSAMTISVDQAPVSTPSAVDPTPAELDIRMKELYDQLGLKVQYNEDGSVKDLYELLGIEPTYDENGNRINTIYEQLGIAPAFDENGNEIPQVFVVKNGVRKVAKVDTTSRVLTRKVSDEEKEAIVIRETLMKKLEEAQKSGDKVQEQNIRKVLEKNIKEEQVTKEEKIPEKRIDKSAPKDLGEKKEEKKSPQKQSEKKDASKGKQVGYAAPKSNGKVVKNVTLSGPAPKPKPASKPKPKQTEIGKLVNGVLDFFNIQPRTKKPEQPGPRVPQTPPTKPQGPQPNQRPQGPQPNRGHENQGNISPNRDREMPRVVPYYPNGFNIPSMTNEQQNKKKQDYNGNGLSIDDQAEKLKQEQEQERKRELNIISKENDEKLKDNMGLNLVEENEFATKNEQHDMFEENKFDGNNINEHQRERELTKNM